VRRILQINVVCGSGSTGRIVDQIGNLLINNGSQSFIAFGRGECITLSSTFKIGNKFSKYWNAMTSRLFDSEGFGSKRSTLLLIKYIIKVKPDIIHLHNLHGYYLNISILFTYLRNSGIPVVWTLHDCWAFTGHCAYFDYVGCNKWKSECSSCPQLSEYPRSLVLDNSRRNYLTKKYLLSGFENFTIVTPSIWLSRIVSQSFLKNYNCRVINNGIDLRIFRPVDGSSIRNRFNLGSRKIVLGVASEWTDRKGLKYFEELSILLGEDVQIILIGLTKSQIRNISRSIIGLTRTSNLNELIAIYSIADVFVNPTLEDNFPTTNLEALACGTPVVTFDTGGSPEAISFDTGLVVPKGNVNLLRSAINEVLENSNRFNAANCRKRAVEFYDSNDRFLNYLNLYEELLS
jgi:glycosyltransferase involved in cell wall biosynthesis